MRLSPSISIAAAAGAALRWVTVHVVSLSERGGRGIGARRL